MSMFVHKGGGGGSKKPKKLSTWFVDGLYKESLIRNTSVIYNRIFDASIIKGLESSKLKVIDFRMSQIFVLLNTTVKICRFCMTII